MQFEIQGWWRNLRRAHDLPPLSAPGGLVDDVAARVEVDDEQVLDRNLRNKRDIVKEALAEGRAVVIRSEGHVYDRF